MTQPRIAQTIDEVLAALDAILARSLEVGSRVGYFAALYRKVTAKVKQGIAEGFFADGPRMERLDVTFANRYLGALEAWERDRSCTRAWRIAFAATEQWSPIILQHLLLGMNPHINLDLGIAAAEVAPGADYPPLQDDFDRINEILFSLVDSVVEEIDSVSPWIALLTRLGGRLDDEIIRFSMEIARCEAWQLGADLAPVPIGQWGPLLELADREAALIGEKVLSPGGFLSLGLLLIRSRETSPVRKVIEVLNGVPTPSFAEIETRMRARQVRAALAGRAGAGRR